MKIRNERDANTNDWTYAPTLKPPYKRPSQWRSMPAFIALLVVFASIGAMLGVGF